MMTISTLTQVEYNRLKPQIFEIFLSQSSYLSHSSEEQLGYFNKWVELYHSKWPDWFFVAIQDNMVLGYVCACPNSVDALPAISFTSYHLFKDYYEKLKLHFHINVKLGQTGSGIGSRMLQHLKMVSLQKQVENCHIITSEHEKNVEFYLKNGFTIVGTQSLGKHKLLLMALDLGLSLPSQIDKNLQS